MKPEQLEDNEYILNEILQYFEGYASEFDGVEGHMKIYEINGKKYFLLPRQWKLFLAIKNKMNNR